MTTRTCRFGHPISGKNALARGKGKKRRVRCRICFNAYMKVYMKRRRREEE